MKKISLVLLSCLIAQFSFSQILKGTEAAKILSSADIIRFEDFSKAPSFIHFNDNVNISVEKSLAITQKFINNSNCKFELSNIQKNKSGSETHRYQQTFNGIPIEFSAWNIQVKNNRVFAMNGEIIDNLQVNTVFSISEEQALQLAMNYVGGTLYMWQDEGEEGLLKEFKKDVNATYFPKAEKIIVPNKVNFKDSELRTAYKFNIYSKKPYKRMNVYVDAITGEILFNMDLLYGSDEIGTAHTQYSGTRTINTEYTGGLYILNDNTRADGVKTMNCLMGIDYNAAVNFTDADNDWNNVNQQLDEYATDAHFATESTYDYYLNVHSRNSIDGEGYPLWSFVHFDLIENGGSSNTNAFWNGQWMTYGDGSGSITPLTTVDICGHEITHGLTSNTCNLNYQDESGSLNEGFSDIFGTAIEFYAVPTYADWTIGEDIGTVFRSISNPNSTNKPDTYQGNYWNVGSDDYGGVHTNGLPLCYAFYLLCEGGSGTNDISNNYNVTGIGINKAEQIFFSLQTQYLTPNSDYHDAWFYCMQAAAELYGACSPEVKSVGDAFYAIGVADPYVAQVHAGFDAVYTESCAPSFQVEFINQSYNGDNFLWNFGDGTTSTQINPVHTYNNFGFFDVQLTVDGSACGSDVELKEDFIVIDQSIPCLTLMPTSGNIVVSQCNGLIYDAGGPAQNYFENTDASLTIYAAGSDQIVLSILNMDIEAGSYGTDCDYDYIAFYDGSSTSASLINSTYYCNSTGNPGTISSTGEYLTISFHSDPGLNLSGFAIQYDCVGSENPPTPYFTSDKQYTCDGAIEFFDNSLNNPTSWNWDFGDGGNSTEQNPSHLYTMSGVYTVSLIVQNGFGNQTLVKNNFINVSLPDNPIIADVQACQNMSFTFDEICDGVLYWYDDPEAVSPVHVGNYWEHPAISAPLTYYVQEFFAGEIYNVGETDNTSGGGSFGNPDYIHYLVFDAFSSFLLKSVEVNADGAGNRTIALRTSTQEIISQTTVYCPNGISRVDLNLFVPVGSNLQLTGLGSPNLFRTNVADFVHFPYIIDNIVSIKKSSAGTNPLNYYYYFYDWQISTPDCISGFTTVALTPEICNYSDILNNSNISISPNPGNGLFHISNIDDLSYNIELLDVTGHKLSGVFNANTENIDIRGLADGVYFVKFLLENNSKVVKIIKTQ